MMLLLSIHLDVSLGDLLYFVIITVCINVSLDLF